MYISYIKNTQSKDWKEIDQNVDNFCLPAVKLPNLAALCNDCLSALILQVIDDETYSVILK